jgi:hypothetical protein
MGFAAAAGLAARAGFATMGFAAAAGLAARAGFAACGSTAAVLAVGLATVPEARFDLGALLLSVTARSLAWTDPRRSETGLAYGGAPRARPASGQ